MAGGENNAFTTNDLTNYYIQLPAENIETACWLESDRMLSLAFSEKSLDVQRKVVCEEFKEHYINRPYGDVAFKMRELAYKKHPYRWMTIGKELSHIENAKLADVKASFINIIVLQMPYLLWQGIFKRTKPWRLRKNGLAIFLPEKNTSAIFRQNQNRKRPGNGSKSRCTPGCII